MNRLAARLLDTAQDGQVGADQLLNYGQGALAETISAAWVAYFVRMAAVAGQCVEAAACLKTWAAALGAMLSGMSGIVWRTEELIIAAEAEAAALGKDATQEVNNLIDEAHSEVSALSAGTTAALSPLPAWVPALPPTSTGPGTVSGGSELSAPADGDPSSLAAPSDPATLSAPADPATASPPSDPATLSAPSDPATLSAPADPATAPATTGVASPSATPGTGASTPAAVSSPSAPAASPAAAGAPAASAPTGQAAAATGAPLNSNPTTPTSAPAATSAPQVASVQSAPLSTTPPPAAWSAPSIPAESARHVDGDAPAAAAAVTPAAPPPAAPPVTGAPPPAAAVGPGAAALPPPVSPAVSPPVASPVTPLHSSSGGIAPPPPSVSKPVVTHLYSSGSDSEPAAGLVSAAAATGSGVRPVNEDLDLLRRIMRAIGGGDVVGYAAAVIVSDGGRQVVLTSDRGRGWMPPGVVVPAEVTSPWDHPESMAWEGLIDPCRVLREYAEAQGVGLAAMVTSRYGGLSEGIPAEHVEVSPRAHPELLRGRVNGRVEWQAAELADTLQSWPHPEDSHRQAMACAWLAHQKAADPDGRRGAVLRAVFDRARQGVRTYDHRAAGAGAAWQPLLERWASRGFDEVRARVNPAGVEVGRLDDSGAAITRPLLATLYADEATIALLRPGPEAREAALYSAAMLGVGAP